MKMLDFQCFLYFCVFLCIGGLDKVIALYFNDTESGAAYYGFFLTAMSLVEIVLPTIANRLSERIGTMINAVLAFFVGSMADKRNKKLFFIIDVASDFIPDLIFTLTRNATFFFIALVFSAIKDVFAPTTFAYKYELFGTFADNDSKFAIATLESVTSAFTFVMPSVMGLLWNCIGRKMFIISLLTIFFSAVLSVFFLPETSGVIKKTEERT